MRATTIPSLFAAALLLGGCMTGGSPDDTRAPLEKVEKADYTSDLMWMEPGADRPVTRAELGDVEAANPVRVEIFEDVAVAWHAPEGEAMYGRHRIMGLWRVWDHTADPQPLDGELETDEGGEADSYETPDQSLEAPDLIAEDLEVDTPRDVATPQVDFPYAILEWRNRFQGPLQDELMNSLDQAHPGCI